MTEKDKVETLLRSLSPSALASLGELLRDQKVPIYHGYLVTQGSFETFVSWRDASSPEQALQVAISDKLQPWYLTTEPQTEKVISMTHDQYCDWLRKE